MASATVGASLVSERPFSQEAPSLVVAHRGASATEAENTLPAFEAAIAAGADVIEFDVRITADGAAVVMHDVDVARTTDGRGRVRDLTREEIARLKITTRDGTATGVPALEDALRCCSGRVGVDVEIKNIPGESDFDAGQELAVEATLRALDATAFSGIVLLSSFNPFSIAHARSLAPDIPTGLLTNVDVDARAAAGYAHAEGHPWVLPFVRQVQDAGASLVEEVHGFGMRLGTWITDDPIEATAFFRAGVDAVATNDPGAIVAARAEAGLA